MASTPKMTVINGIFLPMKDTLALAGTKRCGTGSEHPVAEQDDWFHGWMSVGNDGKILGLGHGQPDGYTPETAANGAFGQIFDAGGSFIAPGFISAHSHIYTSGLRGLAHSDTLYPWVLQNNKALLSADAEEMYWYTLHGALDFVNNGITSAYNFTHSRVAWMYDSASGKNHAAKIHGVEYVTRQFDGTADANLRTVNSFRTDDEAFDEREMTQAFGAICEGSESIRSDLYLGSSIMGAVQWSQTPRTAELEVKMMRQFNVTNQAHFVETAEHIEFQRQKFDWYDNAGAFGADFLFGHFVHPTEHMINRVAESGSSVVWQPTSNGRLGSGIADIVQYVEKGIGIGVGLDDQSCTDISDPFQNMRIGMYTQRAKYSDASVITPREMLRMHTLGSAEVLGVAEKVGSLEVGKYADFVVVDPRKPDTGPIWDVYGTYVLACGLRNMSHVFVGGHCESLRGESTNVLAADSVAELHARITKGSVEVGIPLAVASHSH